MKNKNQPQKIKLSLNKEAITFLNNVGMTKIIGGGGQAGGGQQGGQASTTISNVSFTHTAPSGGCV